jgi:hypothetical protein
MAKKPPSDRTRGASGATLRELHERVKRNRQREDAAGKQQNKLAHPQNRWQRAVRYNWDKNRGRG